ncbi:uncharacterized protein LOC143047333 isoform X2 [Mytilus galloprovincialis]|uniref:uncharacterized protein LOC143047333 isoform X2 n=1 Tax=Mytilus galloprovincialis TaxID=29158 RepID=UPI003F7C181A
MADINSKRQTVHNNEASTCPNYESISISAQSPVTVKSFYQTLCGYFATAKIFVYPDIEIVQEGDKIGFITYTDGEGRSKIKISLPVNALLEYFTKTENRTEFYAYFGCVADVSRNRRKSDFNQKPTLQFSNQTCQTDAGYPKNEGPFHRGASVEIKSQSIKKFVFNGHTSLLESVTYSTSDSLQERDTCILFSWKKIYIHHLLYGK